MSRSAHNSYWRTADLSMLRGHPIIVIADRDAAGRKHAQERTAALSAAGIACYAPWRPVAGYKDLADVVEHHAGQGLAGDALQAAVVNDLERMPADPDEQLPRTLADRLRDFYPLIPAEIWTYNLSPDEFLLFAILDTLGQMSGLAKVTIQAVAEYRGVKPETASKWFTGLKKHGLIRGRSEGHTSSTTRCALSSPTPLTSPRTPESTPSEACSALPTGSSEPPDAGNTSENGSSFYQPELGR